MLTQLTFDDAIALRDRALERVSETAGPSFLDRASSHVLAYLRTHGPTSGEALTEACEAAGISAPDARAFGPVYMRLSRRGLIAKAGFCPRKRGHGTSGGIVWALTGE